MMQIEAMQLKEVGPFSGAVELSGFRSELNVLCGPNELGKSTILRALKILFTEAHTSKKGSIRELQPYRGGAPAIFCQFRLGADVWMLSKQYLAECRAELYQVNGCRKFRGRDVDVALREMLREHGIAPSMFDMIWVGQGESFNQPRMNETARQSIAETVRQEAEIASSGAQLALIYHQVHQELNALVTEKTRKPRGTYQAALDEQHKLKEQLLDAQSRQAASAERQRRLREIHDERAQLEAIIKSGEFQKQIDALRDYAGRAKTAQARILQLDERIEDLRVSEQAAKRQLAEFIRNVEDIAKYKADVQAMYKVVKRQRQLLANCQSKKVDVESQLYELLCEQEKLQQQKMATEQKAHIDHLRSQLIHVELQISKATQALQEQKCKQQKLDNLAINDQKFADLQKTENALQAAQARLDATAPRIKIRYTRDQDKGFLVHGQPASDGQHLTITEPTTITVLGLGEIIVEPGQLLYGTSPHEDCDHLRCILHAHLADCGATDFINAVSLIEQWRACHNELERAQAKLEQFAPFGLGKLRAQRKSLKHEISKIKDRFLDIDTIEFDEVRWLKLDVLIKDAKSEADKYRDQEVTLGQQISQNNIQAKTLLQHAQQLRERISLPSDEYKNHLQKLENAVHQSNEKLGDIQRERVSWQVDMPCKDVLEQKLLRLHQLESDAKNRANQLIYLKGEERELEGALARDIEDGVGYNVEVLEGQLAAAQDKVARLEMDLAALRLLKDELAIAHQRRGSEIIEPLVQRIASYAQDIMPGVTFGLNADWTVANIKRGQNSEKVHNISDGAREQIALLARIAVADLLAQENKSLPFILDDALVFSDDERLNQMFDILADVAQCRQVIVLTCHKRSFWPLVEKHSAGELIITPLNNP